MTQNPSYILAFTITTPGESLSKLWRVKYVYPENNLNSADFKFMPRSLKNESCE